MRGIQKITIGRQYDDPDSEVSSSWCYVDKLNSEGFKNTLYLISIHEERMSYILLMQLLNHLELAKHY